MIRGAPAFWGFTARTEERTSATGESRMAGSAVFIMVGSTTLKGDVWSSQGSLAGANIGMILAIPLIPAGRQEE